MTDLQLASISSSLHELGAGGEATVYQVGSHPDLVYKEYKATLLPQLNAGSLKRQIDFRSTLSPEDRKRLDETTVWPNRIVADGPHVRGFVMAPVPSEFYRRYGLRASPRRVLCEWNHLVYRSEPLGPHMVSEIPTVTFGQIISLITAVARTMELLHRHDIIIGDMSGKNLLWSAGPERVLIIDCDSFRFEGVSGTSGHKESPGWIDPELQGKPTTKSSDIYKLGVAAYRGLWADPGGTVTSKLVRSSRPMDVPARLVSLIEASVGRTSRPSASDWVSELADLYKYGGRPVVSATAAPVVPSAKSRPRLPIRPA